MVRWYQIRNWLRNHLVKRRGCPPATPGWTLKWTLRNGWNWYHDGVVRVSKFKKDRYVAEFKIVDIDGAPVAQSCVRREEYWL